jgi:adenylate cyclase
MADASSSNAAKRRAPVLLGICALITGLLFSAFSFQFIPLTEAEDYVQDWFVRLGRKTVPDPRLVLVGIDRGSYAQDILPSEAEADPVLAALRGNFPWSRTVWASLIERLANAGAKVIVLDMLLASEGAADSQLRTVLEKYRDRVVIGANVESETTERGVSLGLTVPSPSFLPQIGGTPVVLDERVGLVNMWPDDDGVLRRARFRIRNSELSDLVNAGSDAVLETLSARALRKLGERRRIPDEFGPHRFRYTAPPGLGFPVNPIGDVLSAKAWKANYRNGEFFRDKLVLVGPTVNIFHDVHRTPFEDQMAGPELHLNVINAALHGEFLREQPVWANRGLIVLAGLIAAAMCQFIRQAVRRLAIILVLSVAYLVMASLLFSQANLVLLVVAPLLVLSASGLVALGYDFILERLERMKLRHTMGLYFSPRVLEAVLADPGSMQPRRADVTLLLTDLRNSTPLAETLGPQGMFDLLNRVFEVQTGAIMSEEGNLEHFLGDQFLSYWGAPQSQPDAADRSKRAAIKLIMSMEELRGSLPEPVAKLFGYGVALHSGSVLVGNKGSARRLDYGLVGDTVNEAARIEALTKFYGARLLVSGETIRQLQARGVSRLVDRVIVKGKTTPVELFELENPATPTNHAEICRAYEAAYAEYVSGCFAEARALFQKLVDNFADGPSRTLAARCAELLATPPADWKGIWKMDAK